jgi:hypothetical protein
MGIDSIHRLMCNHLPYLETLYRATWLSRAYETIMNSTESDMLRCCTPSVPITFNYITLRELVLYYLRDPSI